MTFYTLLLPIMVGEIYAVVVDRMKMILSKKIFFRETPTSPLRCHLGQNFGPYGRVLH